MDSSKLLELTLFEPLTTINNDSYDNYQLYSQIKEIVGAIFEFDNILFLTKWKNSKDIRVVESRVMNRIFPQMVINYYEQILFKT
ncbi:uncharacterized protein LOC112689795 [Sipha flava]|nr:uncharacterized protein LOC112689795 [Sipha flava]